MTLKDTALEILEKTIAIRDKTKRIDLLCEFILRELKLGEDTIGTSAEDKAKIAQAYMTLRTELQTLCAELPEV